MNERRSSNRCNTSITVDIDDISGKVCNLSLGGMMCFLENKVPTMKQLPIKFTIDDIEINIHGTVLRCEEITKGNFSTGVYFNSPSMSSEYRSAITKFLETSLEGDL